MSEKRNCFQCGNPTELTLDNKALDSGWFACDYCGENIISIKDALAEADRAKEESIRRALGVDDYKPSNK